MTSSSGSLPCTSDELDLGHSLDCGQAFRWRRGSDGSWTGVVEAKILRLRRLNASAIEYRCWPSATDASTTLRRYFRLDVDLAALQARLRHADPRLVEAIENHAGLRVLRQPTLEALLTFVCSPASNITRITRSIDLLARRYGHVLCVVDGERYHAFPSIEALANTAPGELMRTTGLGFRGENLRRVAVELLARSPGWTESLGTLRYEDARAELMTLPSIGPKIADCVCLFGLGHDVAVPVDTHVWGLARELFGGRFRGRTLTPSVYDQVRAAYVERFGPWAGWAQQYLFHGRRAARVLPMPSEVELTRA